MCLGQQFEMRATFKGTSELSFSGTTNINQFSCALSNLQKSDCGITIIEHKDEIVVENIEVNVQLNYFDCGNNKMNHDLKKALKSEEYPIMCLTIKALHFSIDSNSYSCTDDENVEITLAGITKKYNMIFDEASFINNTLILKGYEFIKITDFGIIPPKALFGLIKVDSELVVAFTLVVELDSF